MSFWSFEPSSPHNSQRIDGNQKHNENNTYSHIPTHTNTYQHLTTRINTTQTCRPISFQVARRLHSYARTGVSCMMRTCSVNKERAKVHAPWHSGPDRAVCTERANWTSDHCHCYWEKRREPRHTPHTAPHTTHHHTQRHSTAHHNTKTHNAQHTLSLNTRTRARHTTHDTHTHLPHTTHTTPQHTMHTNTTQNPVHKLHPTVILRVFSSRKVNARICAQSTTDRHLETKKVNVWICAPRSTDHDPTLVKNL